RELHRERGRRAHRGCARADGRSAATSIRAVRRRAPARGRVPRAAVAVAARTVGAVSSAAKSRQVSQSVLSLQQRRPPALDRLLPSGRSLAVAAMLVAASGGIYAIARETTMFALRAVEVEGASPAVAHEIRAALG